MNKVLWVAGFPVAIIAFVVIIRGLVDTPFAVFAVPAAICLMAWAIGVLGIILDSIPTSR